MKSEYLFKEFEADEANTSPSVYELNIISGGRRLYGYLLSPDKRIKTPYPAVYYVARLSRIYHKQ